MKKLMLLLTVLCLSAVSYAQPPGMLIQNFTGCDYLVTFQAAPGCFVMPNCNPPAICVPAGAVIPVPPCGPVNWIWEHAIVMPTDQTCTKVCPPVMVSPSGCMPPVAGGIHCVCGITYTADFTVIPGSLAIY